MARRLEVVHISSIIVHNRITTMTKDGRNQSDIAKEQVSFVTKIGTREQLLNARQLKEKTIEFNVLMCVRRIIWEIGTPQNNKPHLIGILMIN